MLPQQLVAAFELLGILGPSLPIFPPETFGLVLPAGGSQPSSRLVERQLDGACQGLFIAPRVTETKPNGRLLVMPPEAGLLRGLWDGARMSQMASWIVPFFTPLHGAF
ncbi:hypothetical protein KIL84_018394 [Mauremys mutica]|uniref:Uncharacterized protein n=1 Tax=Mauremys mutica TaxID=74926 RepID=A0A9D3XUP9_9SAUR|nr:hypothetical protein KIL84_018394 [Mauremys mutica]